MKPDILEVQPQELKFLFELKKQSTCSIQMINKTDHHVAFKVLTVKTTNPKKYCVRPNTGVIDPHSACEFSVTMQAPKVAPPDMICRDKFLVQSTYVPEGTKELDVTSNMFVRDDGKVVDEKRLKVILLSPPDSPESSPINETSKLLQKDEVKDDMLSSHVDEGIIMEGDGKSVEVIRKEEGVKRKEESPVKRKEEGVVKRNEEYVMVQSKDFTKRHEEEYVQMNDMEVVRLAKDVEEMKSKVKQLESNLNEAKATILHLTEEKRSATQEKHFLQGELDMLRSKRHRAQVGFPLLFVFMVALVSLYFGYLLHP
ncbi:hypothetical protein LXL04_015765 [Taraxacum kok-saghyz]